jgi:ATP-dependent RNA/DNA helicase IGHMBP2
VDKLTELRELQQLLQIEKAADLEFFKTIIQNKPLDQRRKEGFTWYPVQVTRTGYTFGDRAFVTIERSLGEKDEPHQFRSGNVVQLFTNQPNAYKKEFSGTVQSLDKNTMRITLNSKDLPDWLQDGQIGVDLLFDERSYLEMERALRQVVEAHGNRLAELRDIFLGHVPPFEVAMPNFPLNLPRLNVSQNVAVQDILNTHDVSIIHGPPGTGKTTTVVQAVRKLCETEHTVLVTAPSNTAADLLTERLAAEGLTIVRIGNISRVDETIVRHTLESQIAAHPESKNIKKVKIEAAMLRQKSRTFKRKFDYEARSKREQLKEEAKALSAWANQLEDQLIANILDNAQVITCTLVGSAHSVLGNRRFRTVVIDEAAQALEPATWIPILRASKVVLAGDPFQLPPTVKSNEAARAGLSVTLIEKAIQRLPKVNLLNVQYRMHEVIMDFSNQYFYGGALTAHDSVATRELVNFQDEKSITFIDTAGCGFEEKTNSENKSKYNPEEFYILREHLYQYIALFEYEKPSIGIISPYREQVVLMKEELAEDPILKGIVAPTVQTIDGFQGQERDVIYISLVRSNEKAEIGFLADYRRMNVAMTRAKMKLVVIGDSATIGENKFYKAFLDYCEANGTYRSAWSFMTPV